MTAFGVSSMVAPLDWVAVRSPAPTGDYAGAHWAQPLDTGLLLEQHAAFVALLERLGCRVAVLDAIEALPDSCFTYDPAFVTPHGVIELRSAKANRVGEGAALVADLERIGVPAIGQLDGDAVADGGDMLWLDDATLAVGRSYRTNSAAIAQLRGILEPRGIAVDVYDVPHDQGPEWCLHFMSVISPVRADLAVVYEPLAPVALLHELLRRGIDWIAVPAQDYPTLGCNVLAVAPGVAVIADGNDATAQLLADRGVDVHVYAASEISKGEGGPTCLTRPLLRTS